MEREVQQGFGEKTELRLNSGYERRNAMEGSGRGSMSLRERQEKIQRE